MTWRTTGIRMWGAVPRSDRVHRAIPSPNVLMIGGSRVGGAGAAFNGPTALVKPAAVTVIRNGVTLTEYSDPHGPEPGLVDELEVLGHDTAGMTVELYIQEGTSMAQWVSTHIAGAKTTTGARVFGAVIYALSSADSASEAAAGQITGRIQRFDQLVAQTWPGAGRIYVGIENEVAAATLNAIGIAFCRGFTGMRHYQSAIDVELQPDNHPTSAGEVVLGRQLARALLYQGVLHEP